MRKQRDRQPWNPFPLACLKVEGLSACAKTVLIYLGVRSNYKGETCVGHRRMCAELVRSKDFVTRGLAELEDKSYVSKSQRNRHKHQADWRTLSASLILKGRTESSPDVEGLSPEEQDQISKSSPDFGKSSPDQQGKTSQIDSNLPDSRQENLSDQNLKTESVSKSVSEISAPPRPAAAAASAKTPMVKAVTKEMLEHLPSMPEEQARPFIAFLAKRFGLTNSIPAHLYERITKCHGYFVANPHNLDRLEELLDRKDWKKNIRNLDDFAFRWSSYKDGSLYDQLYRVMQNTGFCQNTIFEGETAKVCMADTATQDANRNWYCADCRAAMDEEHRRVEEHERQEQERRAKEAADAQRRVLLKQCEERQFPCPCGRAVTIPKGYPKLQFKCVGCDTLHDTPLDESMLARMTTAVGKGFDIEEGAL
jgi:hypothetical protein